MPDNKHSYLLLGGGRLLHDGTPMVNCILYRVDPETQYVENDTLDSLTVTAYGTDSIIINNQKKVHDISLPLRYTEDFHQADIQV